MREPRGWSFSKSELSNTDPGLEMSIKRKKERKKTEPLIVSFMQLIPEGQTGFLEQVIPSPPPSCQQLCPPWPLNKPGPFRMSPEGHRATLRAWEGHGCCWRLPTLVGNIPCEANLLQVKSIQSAPPGVHWEGSFGMSEARRLKGRPEVNNARGGTSTSRQGTCLQPWELIPPQISLLGSGRCQLEGESDLQACSSPAFSAAQGPGQGPR